MENDAEPTGGKADRRPTATAWSRWCSTARRRPAIITRASPISTFCACSTRSRRASWRKPSRFSAGGASRAIRRRCCSPSTKCATSTDCFAIEFHDIKAHHRLLYGKDVISELVVDERSTARRWSTICAPSCCGCARRRRACCRTKTLLRRLLADSVSTFCVLFRHALILHGRRGATARSAKWSSRRARLSASTPRRSRSCWMCARSASSRARWTRAALLAAYLKQISMVIDAVDRLEK